MIKIAFQVAALIALIIFLWFLAAGCASKPQVIVEYKYIDRNCTAASEVIATPARLKIDWIAIDINASRFYCATQGASLLTNLRSCKQ
ncbi:MAG: hypothetical protein LBF86_01970 [Helicobacteraceae bacterium]|jgi:hypothetical protein|nr:hypothetical protein [Helicobacteraceae bacterium]